MVIIKLSLELTWIIEDFKSSVTTELLGKAHFHLIIKYIKKYHKFKIL